MYKNEIKKLRYVTPLIEVTKIKVEDHLLAASPGVGVGPEVVPPGTDGEDTDLEGSAKGSDLWIFWED